MLKSYVNIALRSLARNPVLSIINILGLAIGVVAFLLVTSLFSLLANTDDFHDKGDQLTIVWTLQDAGRGTSSHYSTWAPLKDQAVRELPEVEQACRITTEMGWLESADKKFEERVAYADPNFFSMFSFEMERGNPSTALDNPNGIVLSQRVADELFGDNNPMGQTIILDQDRDLVVTGVFAEFPKNTTISYAALATMEFHFRQRDEDENSWEREMAHTWLLLSKTADRGAVSSKLERMIKSHLPEDDARQIRKVGLLPIEEINAEWNGMNQFAGLIFSIGAIILVISLINFTNLTTAQTLRREREIGLRKVLGSTRSSLAMQFLCESVLAVLFATLVGGIVTWMILPAFGNMMGGVEIPLPGGHPVVQAAWLLLFSFALGGLAGLYPATVLTHLPPDAALKGRTTIGRRGQRLRAVMVTGHFVLSISMVITSLMVMRQVNYLMTIPQAYDAHNVMVLDVSPRDYPNDEQVGVRLEHFAQQLRELPSVESVSFSSSVPGYYPRWSKNVRSEGLDEPLRVRFASIDNSFPSLYQLSFVDGSADPLEEGVALDDAVMISEMTRDQLGLENPVGSLVDVEGTPKMVTGVFEDFHYSSVTQPIRPLMHLYSDLIDRQFLKISVRPEPGRHDEARSDVLNLWREFDAKRQLDIRYIDDYIEGAMIGERIAGRFTGSAALLAVILAILGLVGLISFALVSRQREIGVRKVLGASTPGVLAMLTRQYLKPVLISNLFAWPGGYFIFQFWIQAYADRAPFSPTPYLLAGVGSMLVGGATVALVGLRAARTNPVNVLRIE
jgi:putative ABC transport system permease protein